MMMLILNFRFRRVIPAGIGDRKMRVHNGPLIVSMRVVAFQMDMDKRADQQSHQYRDNSEKSGAATHKQAKSYIAVKESAFILTKYSENITHDRVCAGIN